MKRIILPVIAGYAVLAAVVMLIFAPAAIWPDLPFRPGTKQATLVWSLYTLVMSAFAAMAGGLVTARLANRSREKAVRVLAILLLVFGLGYAFRNVAVQARDAADPAAQSTQQPREPLWYSFTLVLLSPACALLGGRLRIARKPEAAHTTRSVAAAL
ncbi:MAG: hypothetical protein ACREMQ_02215 [Longimicrobiales bacterium]